MSVETIDVFHRATAVVNRAFEITETAVGRDQRLRGRRGRAERDCKEKEEKKKKKKKRRKGQPRTKKTSHCVDRVWER
jgi:hypothetical protein